MKQHLSSSISISLDNARIVREIGSSGKGRAEKLIWYPDNAKVVISTTMGLWQYHVGNSDWSPKLIHNVVSVGTFTITTNKQLFVVSQETRDFADGPHSLVQIWNISDNIQIGEFDLQKTVIRSMALSPNESVLALGAYGSIQLWDVQQHQRYTDLQLEGYVNALAFSSNGTTLASGGEDGVVRLWDTKPASQRVSMAYEHPVHIHNIAFSPDGSILATGGADNNVYIWDTASGRELGRFPSSIAAQLGKIMFSPDGSLIATSNLETGLKLWRIDTKALHREAIEADDPVGAFPISMAFSPDGTKLASVGFDYHIRVWDTNTGKLLAQNDEFTFDVNQVAYKQNNELIALSNTSLTTWSLATDEHSANLSIDGQLLALSPEKRILATVKGLKTYLWDLQTLSQLAVAQSHRSAVTDLDFSPDGNLLAIGGDDGNTVPDEGGRLMAASKVYLWNIIEQSTQTILEISFQRGLAFSDDGIFLAAGCRDGKVRLWNLHQNAEHAALDTGFSLSFNLAFSPDGSLLAVGLDKGFIQIWSVNTLEKRLTIQPFTQPITGLQFTHDSLVLICTNWQNNIELWSVEDRIRLAVLEGHRGYIRDIALSPDGKILASASVDGSVRLWGVIETA